MGLRRAQSAQDRVRQRGVQQEVLVDAGAAQHDEVLGVLKSVVGFIACHGTRTYLAH